MTALATRPQLEAAQAAELARLRTENEQLREMVEELQGALGMSMTVPPAFNVPAGARRQIWRFICAMAARGILTHDAAIIAMDTGRAQHPSPKVIAQHVVGARVFLEKHGVLIRTEYGMGWSMTKPMQIRTQRLINQLIKRGAAA